MNLLGHPLDSFSYLAMRIYLSVGRSRVESTQWKWSFYPFFSDFQGIYFTRYETSISPPLALTAQTIYTLDTEISLLRITLSKNRWLKQNEMGLLLQNKNLCNNFNWTLHAYLFQMRVAFHVQPFSNVLQSKAEKTIMAYEIH